MTATTPSDIPTYTEAKPPLPRPLDEIRATIPGWGADLDPADRPSFPREVPQPDHSGAHWSFPDRQPETYPRERSIEHAFLTPVFGTSCPPRGLSGKVRRLAYARYSEGRAAHWLLLMAADRIDVKEAMLRSFVTLRPDNPITQTGISSELKRHGAKSRFGRNRTDVVHQALDPVIVAGPWVLGGWLAYRAAKRVLG
ncbi:MULTISPECIES: hypothetical protein [unclassified Mumia]|uniref:hypothetical protein n=1 Tax=unclassified Mumia TaxID=2621872 RepID=UPI0021022FFC|nr:MULTISPECIES: hypothetical protein [unclassified Mumia]